MEFHSHTQLAVRTSLHVDELDALSPIVVYVHCHPSFLHQLFHVFSVIYTFFLSIRMHVSSRISIYLSLEKQQPPPSEQLKNSTNHCQPFF